MDIGIIGLPRSGKTTIFNAVTRGRAQTAAHADTRGKPNVGVAKVPDPRLDMLYQMFKPRRKVQAEVTYIDVPAAPEGLGKTRGISGEFLNNLQRADAILIVARAFQDPAVEHIQGSVDSFRDIETMLYELTFSDLGILERRLTRLLERSKGARAHERDAISREQDLLDRVKQDLESGVRISEQKLSEEEARLLEGFQLLTAKPLIIVANVGEEQLQEVPAMEARLEATFHGPRVRTAALCGILEMELAQMEPAEEKEFRESMGLGESGLDRMVRLSYDVLGLINFFTVGEDEVRAWPIARGTPAVRAAGKVHSDMERGFIRAEVVSYDALMACGSMAEARRRGLLRQEGKSYIVNDGDIITFLFNV